MKYLLIDFGATYIKTGVYNKDTQEYKKGAKTTSPFKCSDRISKDELLNILKSLTNNIDIDGIVICTILGGGYIGDVYHSWKSPDTKLPSCVRTHCMISGLFKSRVHCHHKPFTTSNKYNAGLHEIGKINGKPIYSSLGDTDCVIESLELNEDTKAINMGTGSQVIALDSIERYFPAGRAFLAYQKLFESLNLDMFELMSTITVEDVLKSDLRIDLAVFPQARLYNDGGSITNIKEDNFTIQNLLGSMIKEFVLQYQSHISDVSTILLVGGIARNIKILPELFQIYNPSKEFILVEDDIESTHKGMIKYINKWLV